MQKLDRLNRIVRSAGGRPAASTAGSRTSAASLAPLAFAPCSQQLPSRLQEEPQLALRFPRARVGRDRGRAGRSNRPRPIPSLAEGCARPSPLRRRPSRRQPGAGRHNRRHKRPARRDPPIRGAASRGRDPMRGASILSTKLTPFPRLEGEPTPKVGRSSRNVTRLPDRSRFGPFRLLLQGAARTIAREVRRQETTHGLGPEKGHPRSHGSAVGR